MYIINHQNTKFSKKLQQPQLNPKKRYMKSIQKMGQTALPSPAGPSSSSPNQSQQLYSHCQQQTMLLSIAKNEKQKSKLQIWQTQKLWKFCQQNSKNITILVIIIFVMIGGGVGIRIAKGNQRDQPIQKKMMSQFLEEAADRVQGNFARKYTNIQIFQQQFIRAKQLPFCIIIDDRLPQQKINQILISIHSQNYKEMTILNQPILISPSSISSSAFFSPTSYNSLSSQINKQCKQTSILLFLNDSIFKENGREKDNKNNVLAQLNLIYQKNFIWMTYWAQGQEQNGQDNGKGRIGVSSMYRRVWELVRNNDFQGFGEKNRYFQYGVYEDKRVGDLSKNFLILSLLQLCQYFSYPFSMPSPFISSLSSDSLLLTRHKYQPLLSLDQDFKIDIKSLIPLRNKFYASNQTLKSIDLFRRMDHQVTHEDMKQVIEFQQLIYLDENHILRELQKSKLRKKYNIDISKSHDPFSAKSPNRFQLPICACIFSHNNEQNNRYKKVLLSILQQNYLNYHVIFIDDFSSDRTLALTSQFLSSRLPRQKFTLIHNRVQKLATYNILNAAYEHCRLGDLQIIIDGDDELIGGEVFSFVNMAFSKDQQKVIKENSQEGKIQSRVQERRNNIWLMHSFYKNNFYTEGFNLGPMEDWFIYGPFGGRRFMYFFSPLRVWDVRLIRALPLSQHISPWTGDWHDTAYDISLQYGMYEISGQQRVRYYKQINYLYVTGYGGNDDSSIWKGVRRNIIHFLISMRKKLDKIDTLDEVRDGDKEVKVRLQADRGKIWEIINPQQFQV